MRSAGSRAAPAAGLRVTLAVAVTGLGAFLAGSAMPAPSAHVIGGNVPVNPGAGDPFDLSASNSPRVVRNPVRPGNLVVVNRIDSPTFSCAMHVSTDGGATWAPSALPFPPGEESPPRCYAPDAAFGPDGTLYVSFVTLAGEGNVPNAVWVASSRDGGRTVAEPARAAGALAFQVRLLADPARPGRLHLAWVQAAEVGLYAFTGTDNPVVAARSDDGGATWSGPHRVSPLARRRVVAPSGAVGPDGRLYLAYLDLGDDRLDYHGAHEGRGGEPYAGTWSLVLARSGDGAVWTEAVVDPGLVPTGRFVVFLPPLPSVAVAGGGTVHVAFHDGRRGDADVWLWTSPDGGRRFGRPRRVNDTPAGDGTSQYLPQVALAPGGRLDVAYYDRRADADDVLTEVSLQSSTDGGRSFGRRVRVSDRAFDSRIGPGRDRGLVDPGSRLGLLSTGSQALVVWTDTRGATEAREQDLARAVVAFQPGSRARQPLRVAGGALTLAAAGLAARSAARRRAGRTIALAPERW